MSLTINTNTLSLKVQHSLTSATKSIDKAIEKMTTGYRINSAKDDAAGYAVASRMEIKLSSYEVAQQNVAIGNSLIDTATGNMDVLTDHLQRIRDLCEQAANGTYSANSRRAMQEEIDQRVEEINRVISSTEYNDIKLFSGDSSSTSSTSSSGTKFTLTSVTASKGPNGKFISDVSTVTPDITCDKTNTTTAADLRAKIADSANTVIGIADAETFALLSKVVNGDGVAALNCSGKTICLTQDIDLSTVCSATLGSWTAIGDWDSVGGSGHMFSGDFNGNGHVVSNLYINSSNVYQGLFGLVDGEIKNVGVENCNITGTNDDVAGLVGYSMSDISDCYVTGTISGTTFVGGIAGQCDGNVSNCYSSGTVTGTGDDVGGLIGSIEDMDVTVSNSYSTANVTGGGDEVGGLIGLIKGDTTGATLTNCHATGTVSGSGNNTGGLAGKITNTTVTDSYATGNVSGVSNVGGFAGYGYNITKCYSTGAVTGTGSSIGGFLGDLEGPVTNCYSKGNVTGDYKVGGFDVYP